MINRATRRRKCSPECSSSSSSTASNPGGLAKPGARTLLAVREISFVRSFHNNKPGGGGTTLPQIGIASRSVGRARTATVRCRGRAGGGYPIYIGLKQISRFQRSSEHHNASGINTHRVFPPCRFTLKLVANRWYRPSKKRKNTHARKETNHQRPLTRKSFLPCQANKFCRTSDPVEAAHPRAIGDHLGTVGEPPSPAPRSTGLGPGTGPPQAAACSPACSPSLPQSQHAHSKRSDIARYAHTGESVQSPALTQSDQRKKQFQPA